MCHIVYKVILHITELLLSEYYNNDESKNPQYDNSKQNRRHKNPQGIKYVFVPGGKIQM